jgi:hypothetical protein
MNKSHVTFAAKLERKHPKLPVYVVVPSNQAKALELLATTVVEGTANGRAIGRRSIKRWDNSTQSPWFVEFTMSFCNQAGIAVGDKLQISLWLASSELPVELAHELKQSRSLRAAWNSLSEYARRTSIEHVHAAKTPATRSRRAAAIVAKLSQAG